MNRQCLMQNWQDCTQFMDYVSYHKIKIVVNLTALDKVFVGKHGHECPDLEIPCNTIVLAVLVQKNSVAEF
ncbi:hypothetical protein OIU76_013187 [Salix suchowensis]|nr:hypothetical protein OIU76_013187 [Salix suchowensis]